ncbi:TPA: hypothetical protein RFY33_003298 [Klebsiella aerogenes]|uniref:hypothetical protein n=1 Tax=Klebsiella aerogenes TaxID=548 RepID=UPI000907F2D4|nr:hypothetical protein [Klebsiella aerogenes]EIV5803169.1 hypothetical protein [Klebsiella aerogenes]MBK0714457.1 hypothetical protein [Klebsiella aerogenes]MCU6423733.1 hypothetical protein [Klebsiella aerogenes]MEB5841055.1 hypothetical protein [Klebsiella aerogenes]MEB5894819.1 hypothetical protein [Klebsiella aerogenes]
MTADLTPVQKGTILLLSGSKEHIYFICNDPVFYPKLVKETFLAVNLTSISDAFEPDRTCILDVGDHPFVRHPSYIFYRRAEIFGAETVTNRITAGDIRVHQPCEDITFQRILDGFSVSPHVKPVIRNYYQRYCVPVVPDAVA